MNSATGIGVDPASASIGSNEVWGRSGGPANTTAIGIHFNNSTGTIASNTVTGNGTNLSVGILVENGTVANQPVIGSAGEGNTINGGGSSANDAIGIWCVNADPTIQNNDLIIGSNTLTNNQAIGVFLDDCDNVTISNNTRIEGGPTDDTVGWSVGIRADFSTGTTISSNPMITGGGSLVSTGILFFGNSSGTITGNTVNAGSATSLNEAIVFSGSGGTVTNNTIDANGAGGMDAYGIRLFGCSNPAMGPAGGNTFQGASGNGRHLWNGNIPNVGAPPPCGVSPLTVNAAGNTWSETPAPAGLQCGPANDSFPTTRNYEIVNAGHCIQF